MFAGPNGSGKSTLKRELAPQWLGTYINADEIEQALRDQGNTLSLSEYGVSATSGELAHFLQNSTLLELAGLRGALDRVCVEDGRLALGPIDVNSYHAAVVADFIRTKLLAARVTFSFETVMSGPDKVDLLCRSRESGYRTYLYFVATEDPAINISRVGLRVQQGGHAVPADKIRERYERSLAKLLDAIRCADRAYIFDNSGKELVLLAEITDSREIELKVDAVPHWFDQAVLAKLSPISPELEQEPD